MISTFYIGAFPDSATTRDYNLTIGASSNVIMQAAAGINMYINSNSSFTLFGTSPLGSNAFPFFEVKSSNGDVFMIADGTQINFSNLAAVAAGVVLSNNPAPVYSNFTDIVINGDFNVDNSLSIGDTLNVTNQANFGDSVNVTNNVTIGDSAAIRNNLAIGGNLFSSTMNLYTTNPNRNITRNLRRVGYSFHINAYNQLELLRSDQITSNNRIITKMNRVLTFGNTEFGVDKQDPNLYTIMSDFSGIYGDFSNGSTPTFTSNVAGAGAGDSFWMQTSSNIYYASGFVGIGTNSPISRLHVSGTTTFEGSAEPKTDAVHSLGKSNGRFKDLFLSSGIVVGTSKISVDANGNFLFTKQNGSPAMASNGQGSSGWTQNGSSLFVMNSNVGIGTSTPAFRLDVSGAMRAIGYCNLLVDSYNSTSIHQAPTASNFAVAYSKIVATSNVAYTSGAAWASNGASWASNGASWASNGAAWASNLAIASSNSAYASTVIALAIHCIAEYASNAILDLQSNAIYASNGLSSAYYASNAITSLQSNANYASNAASGVSGQATFASNAAKYASNAAVYSSNAASGVSGQATFASNAAVYSSNAAVYSSNAAANAFAMTSNTSNVAYAAYGYSIDANNAAIDASNAAFSFSSAAAYASNAASNRPWQTSNNSVYVFNSNVGIGTSNPSVKLEVAGSIKATSGFDGPNIAKKIDSGSASIGASPVTLLSLSNANASKFYEFNVGPGSVGNPYFAKALVFWNAQNNTVSVFGIVNNVVSLQASSSNIRVSAAPSAEVYPWSLYELH